MTKTKKKSTKATRPAKAEKAESNPKYPTLPRLYSVPELAEVKGVTRTAVLVACRQGRIPGAVLVGRAWIIPEWSARDYEPRAWTHSSEKAA